MQLLSSDKRVMTYVDVSGYPIVHVHCALQYFARGLWKVIYTFLSITLFALKMLKKNFDPFTYDPLTYKKLMKSYFFSQIIFRIVLKNYDFFCVSNFL